MDKLATLFQKFRIRDKAPFVILVLLVLLIGVVSPRFLSAQSLLLLLADASTIFIMAAGLTFVILLGGIDLSVQSIASLASVVLAVSAARMGAAAPALAILIGLLLGGVSGLCQSVLKIPSFIGTLAMGGIAATLALLLSGTRSVPIDVSITHGSLGWLTGNLFGISSVILIAAAVLLGGVVMERLTILGRWSVAVGAGERAAIVAGIPTNGVKVGTLMLSGALASLAGVVMGARLSAGSPTLANAFLLPAIAAVCVGGTALTGGVGSILRTALGALIISVVRIGMTFLKVDIFAQQIAFGAVLVLAVAVTIDRQKIAVMK